MIDTGDLTDIERSQLERKDLARGAWRNGQAQNALLILESVTSEEMTPRVAGEVYVTEASFRSESHDYRGSLESLQKAEPFIDDCASVVQGSFYLQRGLANRRLGNIDAALTDYTGAIIHWQAAKLPDYEIAVRINLAELFLIRDDLRQAREHIDQAFELLSPDSTHYCNAHDTKAKILLRQGELGKAVTHSRIAIEAAGENEMWKADALATFELIKSTVLEGAERVFTVKDLKDLKQRIIENALQAAGGSIVEAAKLVETSHQLIAYTADKKHLKRSAPRKKSIIKVAH